MALTPFQQSAGEIVLYHSRSNHKWYTIAWKITAGLMVIVFISILLESLLGLPTRTFLEGFLPEQAADLLVIILFFGVTPLLMAAWVAEEIAGAFTGEFILTDRRLWYKGAPYAWSQGELPLEDVASMVFRRDAVFVRQRSNRKIHVFPVPDGKLFVKAYDQFLEKD